MAVIPHHDAPETMHISIRKGRAKTLPYNNYGNAYVGTGLPDGPLQETPLCGRPVEDAGPDIKSMYCFPGNVQK